MARTTSDDTFNPQLLNDTVQGHMSGKNAIKGGMLVAAGAAVVEPGFSGGRGQLGKLVDVPYFGTIGEFEENVADGAAATPRKIGMTSEQATVERDTLAFETTTWAQASASADPHAEAGRLIAMAAVKQQDKRIMEAAIATGAPVVSAAAIGYDATIDAKYKFGDEQEDVVAMVVHSQVMRELVKLKDTQNRPLLIDSLQDDGFQRFAGMLVGVSDRVDISTSTMGAITSTGTTPPVVAISSDTPLGAYTLRVEIVAGGTVGNATFKFSTDDGDTFSETYATAASFVLDESASGAVPAPDSLVGRNGATGLTITFAAGTYNADNVYRAKANLIASSIILKKNSIAYWFNRSAMALQTDKDILRDSQLGAMHMYNTALRYRRRPGSSGGGVINMLNTSPEFNGTL